MGCVEGLSASSAISPPDWVPHRNMWVRMRNRGLIRLWESWQGMALVDHVVFLGNWDSRFNTRTLAANGHGSESVGFR
jgi:hypothetical protein